ncbi:hypothetical protein ACHAPT_001382 [Fusarium lateritium]
MDTPLAAVEYQLYAKALCTEREPVVCNKVFKVERILEAEASKQLHAYDFNSTNITADLRLDSVVRPGGTNAVHIRIDNITSSLAVGLEVWKLKKVTWSLEETVSVTLPNCPRHLATPTGQGTGHDSSHQSATRILGKKSLRHGWDEHIEPRRYIAFNFDYSLNRVGSDTLYVCDESAGPEVKHALHIEIHLGKHFVLPEAPRVSSPPRAETTLRMTRPVLLVDLVEASAPPAYGESSDRLPDYADVSS